MIYPSNFEQKIGFDKLRARLQTLCISSLGKDYVDNVHFIKDYELLQHLLSVCNEMIVILRTEENFPAENFIDCTNYLNRLRIEGTFIEPEEMFKLSLSLTTIKKLTNFFKEKGEEKYPILFSKSSEVKVFPFVQDRIDQIVARNGSIKDAASPALHKIRKEMAALETEISRRMARIMEHARQQGWSEEGASPAVRDGRLVIPVDATHKRKLKGFIYDESATGKTVYIEPAELVELNNDLKEAEHAERREIIKVLIGFANDIRPYIDELLIGYDFIGLIDFNRAKALFANETQSVIPPLNNKPVLEWYNAIHPLLYYHLKEEGKKVVPLNIRLNETHRILVISGPNAGGKSVCLQTAALLQYMLQCGLPIAVKETSETGIFDQIFIDIGDEQSIENDLSTYSSHLLNMKHFVKNTNDRTLFLIDEFGAGTEPMLGGAIAESILEQLNNVSSYGIVTTHYTNLKHFASQAQGIVNGAMLYDTQHLQPLFQLVIGEPGSSFAFEIAKKIGMPEVILKAATEKVGEKHIDYDKNLKEIIRDKYYWQQKRNQVKDTAKKLDDITSRYSTELEDIKKLRKETLKKAQEEAQAILAGVNKQIEHTIKEIKEKQAEKEITKQLRQNLEKKKQEVAEALNIEDEQINRKIEQLKRREENKKRREAEKSNTPEVKEPEKPKKAEFETGDKVKIFGQDNIGEVINVNGKNIMVGFGNMITTLDEKRLVKISHSEFKKIQKTNQSHTPFSSRSIDIIEKKKNFKMQLDIRGMRADEAMQKVADYIDEAIIVDVSEVRILHGKGNGILRQLVREYLQTIELVKSYGDEHVDMGGAGITLVKF